MLPERLKGYRMYWGFFSMNVAAVIQILNAIIRIFDIIILFLKGRLFNGHQERNL